MQILPGEDDFACAAALLLSGCCCCSPSSITTSSLPHSKSVVNLQECHNTRAAAITVGLHMVHRSPWQDSVASTCTDADHSALMFAWGNNTVARGFIQSCERNKKHTIRNAPKQILMDVMHAAVLPCSACSDILTHRLSQQQQPLQKLPLLAAADAASLRAASCP